MTALDRKLWRDLISMRGQAFAIALVIASGVATFVMSISTLDSLRLTQSTFYQEYRFAQVFASLKRAPESVRLRIAEIPGVAKVETRVIAAVNLDIADFPEPVTGQLISIPDAGEPLLNKLYIRQGRLVEPGRNNEVVVGEVFAQAHGFKPGDKLGAIINGRRKTLTIVGIAISPEYVYQISPGAIFPDFKRFGVLWMGRIPLSTAYDMEGAFNNVVLSLSTEARLNEVIHRLDALLETYGGLGAYGRKNQLSHRYLSEEFRQLGQMAAIFPVIFLGVAAFLLNIVVSRLVSTQREQIASLKAFGYSNLAISLHYVKLIILIVLLGVAGGLAAGAWFGKGMSEMYMDYYRFPSLTYKLRFSVGVNAALVSTAAALIGTLYAVRSAVMLRPAEAMRPEPPSIYRESLVERMGLKQLLSQPSRMIIRHIERKPVKALLSAIGISLACAIMMVGSFFKDAVDFMVMVQFGLSQREDLAVTFVEPTSRRALYELQRLPGVKYGEVFRAVPARFRFQHRSYRGSIQGVEPGSDLQRLLNAELQPIEPPAAGIMLTDHLGKMLGVRPGDLLTVEVLEGSRPIRQITVAALVSQYIGVSGYMQIDALNRFMREGNAVSGVNLAMDERYKSEIYNALKEMPRVAGIVQRKEAVKNFYKTMGEQILVFAFFNTLLAATIAFGVVYNSARIALSERSRELASLRVMGFTRAEISYILLGELAVLTLVAIPLGFVIGYSLCAYMIIYLQTDLFRIPLILEPSTYAFAASVVVVSAGISGLIVRRKLDRLDLIAVLKTKE
jgi:putative ABC transport system permease protein